MKRSYNNYEDGQLSDDDINNIIDTCVNPNTGNVTSTNTAKTTNTTTSITTTNTTNNAINTTVSTIHKKNKNKRVTFDIARNTTHDITHSNISNNQGVNNNTNNIASNNTTSNNTTSNNTTSNNTISNKDTISSNNTINSSSIIYSSTYGNDYSNAYSNAHSNAYSSAYGNSYDINTIKSNISVPLCNNIVNTNNIISTINSPNINYYETDQALNYIKSLTGAMSVKIIKQIVDLIAENTPTIDNVSNIQQLVKLYETYNNPSPEILCNVITKCIALKNTDPTMISCIRLLTSIREYILTEKPIFKVSEIKILFDGFSQFNVSNDDLKKLFFEKRFKCIGNLQLCDIADMLIMMYEYNITVNNNLLYGIRSLITKRYDEFSTDGGKAISKILVSFTKLNINHVGTLHTIVMHLAEQVNGINFKYIPNIVKSLSIFGVYSKKLFNSFAEIVAKNASQYDSYDIRKITSSYSYFHISKSSDEYLFASLAFQELTKTLMGANISPHDITSIMQSYAIMDLYDADLFDRFMILLNIANVNESKINDIKLTYGYLYLLDKNKLYWLNNVSINSITSEKLREVDDCIKLLDEMKFPSTGESINHIECHIVLKNTKTIIEFIDMNSRTCTERLTGLVQLKHRLLQSYGYKVIIIDVEFYSGILSTHDRKKYLKNKIYFD